MRLNVRTKLVTAKQRIAAKKSVAFPFEIKIFWQPIYFITALFHPFREERLLAGALLMAKIAGDKFAANRQPGIGGENHIRKPGLRWNQMNLTVEVRETRVQLFPLLLRQNCLGAAGPVHPRIDLVLDAVVIGRTEKQFTHRTDNLVAKGRLS